MRLSKLIGTVLSILCLASSNARRWSHFPEGEADQERTGRDGTARDKRTDGTDKQAGQQGSRHNEQAIRQHKRARRKKNKHAA